MPRYRDVPVATRWCRVIHRIILRLSRSFPTAPAADIEDAVAEAVAQWWVIHRDLDHVRIERWVSTRAGWRVLDALRRGLSEVTLREGHLVSEGPHDAVERAQVLRRAARAVLTQATAEVIELWFSGWTSPEISAGLRISENAVRKRLERAIIRLR